MTWTQLGNLVVVLTLLGIAYKLAKSIWDTFHSITGFFHRQELHMQSLESKLDETLIWFKKVLHHEPE